MLFGKKMLRFSVRTLATTSLVAMSLAVSGCSKGTPENSGTTDSGDTTNTPAGDQMAQAGNPDGGRQGGYGGDANRSPDGSDGDTTNVGFDGGGYGGDANRSPDGTDGDGGDTTNVGFQGDGGYGGDANRKPDGDGSGGDTTNVGFQGDGGYGGDANRKPDGSGDGDTTNVGFQGDGGYGGDANRKPEGDTTNVGQPGTSGYGGDANRQRPDGSGGDTTNVGLPGEGGYGGDAGRQRPGEGGDTTNVGTGGYGGDAGRQGQGGPGLGGGPNLGRGVGGPGQGGGGAQAPPATSPLYPMYHVTLALNKGDIKGLSKFISARARGKLATLRSGKLSAKEIAEYKAAFAKPTVPKTRAKNGETSATMKSGDFTITMKAKKEGKAYVLTSLSFRKSR